MNTLADAAEATSATDEEIIARAFEFQRPRCDRIVAALLRRSGPSH